MAKLKVKDASRLRELINKQFIQRVTTQQCRNTEDLAAELLRQYPGDENNIQEYREVIVGLLLELNL